MRIREAAGRLTSTAGPTTAVTSRPAPVAVPAQVTQVAPPAISPPPTGFKRIAEAAERLVSPPPPVYKAAPAPTPVVAPAPTPPPSMITISPVERPSGSVASVYMPTTPAAQPPSTPISAQPPSLFATSQAYTQSHDPCGPGYVGRQPCNQPSAFTYTTQGGSALTAGASEAGLKTALPSAAPIASAAVPAVAGAGGWILPLFGIGIVLFFFMRREARG